MQLNLIKLKLKQKEKKSVLHWMDANIKINLQARICGVGIKKKKLNRPLGTIKNLDRIPISSSDKNICLWIIETLDTHKLVTLSPRNIELNME